MIEFKNLSKEEPYMVFKEKYNNALNKKQKNIEAMSVSSFNKVSNEVDSRMVNLKFIDKNEFIFFSNYESPKSIAFDSNNKISALFFWSSVNVQVRMKAKIKRTSISFNNRYFKTRNINKNALAISSNQSNIIASYDQIIQNYEKVKNNDNLKKCPKYWGGYSFRPYEIEFWEGNEFRLNKRNLYRKDNTTWNHFILEP
jgi:pyridoxamine 5'-phosphate oxidase